MVATNFGSHALVLIGALIAGCANPAPQPPAPPDSAAAEEDEKTDPVVEEWVSGRKNEVILRGEITVHSRMRKDVPPGGKLHLRLVDIGRLGRPFLFRLFTDVKFPFQYEIKTADFVTETGLKTLLDRRYYVEALYYDFPVNGRVLKRWEGAFGQGWGAPGRPFPLAFGQTRNIEINGWDSAELTGKIEPPPG